MSMLLVASRSNRALHHAICTLVSFGLVLGNSRRIESGDLVKGLCILSCHHDRSSLLLASITVSQVSAELSLNIPF